jgi:hypothetical protein
VYGIHVYDRLVFTFIRSNLTWKCNVSDRHAATCYITRRPLFEGSNGQLTVELGNKSLRLGGFGRRDRVYWGTFLGCMTVLNMVREMSTRAARRMGQTKCAHFADLLQVDLAGIAKGELATQAESVLGSSIVTDAH